MQHRRLGRSAIYVSDICMGTMTFGSQADEAESLRILDASFDAGINFYDTAGIIPCRRIPNGPGVRRKSSASG
jgi:aryl-alcohol dehydrogenase-like predicted oxidoreductase